MCFRRNRFVTFQRGSLDERQEAILALLDSADNGLPLREIYARRLFDANKRQVRRALVGLRDSGLVASTGRGLAARWKRIRNQ